LVKQSARLPRPARLAQRLSSNTSKLLQTRNRSACLILLMISKLYIEMTSIPLMPNVSSQVCCPPNTWPSACLDPLNLHFVDVATSRSFSSGIYHLLLSMVASFHIVWPPEQVFPIRWLAPPAHQYSLVNLHFLLLLQLSCKVQPPTMFILLHHQKLFPLRLRSFPREHAWPLFATPTLVRQGSGPSLILSPQVASR